MGLKFVFISLMERIKCVKNRGVFKKRLPYSSPIDTCGLKLPPKLEQDTFVLSHSSQTMCNLHKNRAIGSNASSLRRTLDELNKPPEIQELTYQDIRNIHLIKKIDAQFRNLKPLEYPTTVYRGEVQGAFGYKSFERYFAKISNAKKGDIITPSNGYSFYGDSKSCLELFGKSNSSENLAITYTTYLPKESMVSRGISTNAEYGIEYITPRGAKHRVLSVEKVSPNKLHLETELIIDDLPTEISIPEQFKYMEQKLLEKGEL